MENKKEYIAPDAQIIPTDSVDTVAASGAIELPIIPVTSNRNGKYDF
jgi:hypothetical protein